MNSIQIKPFHVAGITVRTTNENGQSAKDIPALWNKFLSENIIAQIPNKVDGDIYCVYTDYEKDHTKPYTTMVGCKVENVDHLPPGLVGKSFKGGHYTIFTAKGNLMEGIVFQEWTRIWQSDINRVYTADFEIYGAKAQPANDVAVDIFIAVE